MGPSTREMRVLILAPTGRDAATIDELLRKAGIVALTCGTLADMLAVTTEGIGAVLIAEEALTGADFLALKNVIAAQPPWSDLPFVVLSSNRSHPSVITWREQLLSSLRNVSLLERPVQGITLVSAIRAALRARGRQYEVKAHLEERQRSAEELEGLVAARTRELETANAALQEQMRERAEIEDRLRHAQKIEAIGQLTGGVAHDFNNLLMVITGGLNMLERRPERRAEVMGAMQKAAQRGARLTHQLLAFARRQALKPQAVDLKRFLDEMSELLDRSLRGDVTVTTEIAEDVWPITADPGELQLVLLNLAVNARDAMPHGGSIIIRVENAPQEAVTMPAADFVQIAVIDNGTGMSPQTMSRVFEPFFTTKDVGKGSGLGLAQVHGFVTQSGGAVKIASTIGQGTTVTLLLPRSRREPERADAKPAHVQTDLQKVRGHVLLVEDQDEVAALVAQMLRELGYEVTRAAGAAAALGALANGRAIDLVFSDVMMPDGMNGLELSREIRRRRPDLPVLLTSGYAEGLQRDVQTEGIQLLPKPYEIDDLAAALDALQATPPRQGLH